jgi:putative ABC transport system permease protein
LILVTWGLPVVLALSAAQIPRTADIVIDWRVWLFLATVSVVTGMLFGLAPAVAAMRTNVRHAMKGTDSGTSRGFRRFRDGLAAAEVALAFVLVISAGLLVRELLRLRTADIGIASANVLTMHLAPNLTARDCYELAEQVAAVPGVRAAAFAQMLPLQSWGWTATFSIVGRRPFSPAERPVVELRYITPRYFDALGIPLRRGRAFTDADTATAPRAIIVNETLAERYFPNVDPVGQATDRGTIVGVVADVRQAGIDRPVLPDIYYPIAQNMSQVRDLGMSLIVSTLVPTTAVAGSIRDSIRRTHPHLAIFGMRTMDEIVTDSLATTTFYTSLVGLFASLALVLAAAGVYGVISYAVAARTREFGIRLALGADGRRLRMLVLRHAVVVTAAGLAVGLADVAGVARFLGRLIAGADDVRPAAVATAAGILAAVALAAAFVPARRAARVDPMGALREE